MKTAEESEREIWIKEQRIFYWEKFGVVPSRRDLIMFNSHYGGLEI